MWWVLLIYNNLLCWKNQVQLLAEEDDDATSTTGNNKFSDDGAKTIDQELRQLLTKIFIDNTNLRKEVNSVMRYVLKQNMSDKDNNEQLLEHIVQNMSIDRWI